MGDLPGDESPFSDLGSRNTWLRSSLRKSPKTHHNAFGRRWTSLRAPSGSRRILPPSSNAVASELFRTSSFNSGRSSSGCEVDEGPCSDGSLEEEVGDLNTRVQVLQDHVLNLTERQSDTDDRYQRVRNENATLVERIHALEEQLRETELRSDEKLDEERRRARDGSARTEREREMERDNFRIRLEALERERDAALRDSSEARQEAETVRGENRALSRQLMEVEVAMGSVKREVATLATRLTEEREERARERESSVHLVETLNQEMGILRQYQRDGSSGHGSLTNGVSNDRNILEEELAFYRGEHKRLSEANEELQAQLLSKGLDVGQELLKNGHMAHESLAVEMEMADESELREALREQQEVNRRLRTYIDGILLNIVENYPQLLEVKSSSTSTSSHSSLNNSPPISPTKRES